MSHNEEVGTLVRSVPVPPQVNDPDITVLSLDLHTDGFVVRFKSSGELPTDGLTSMRVRDGLGTPYEHVGQGDGFDVYRPAIPAHAKWVEVLTKPPTRVAI